MQGIWLWTKEGYELITLAVQANPEHSSQIRKLRYQAKFGYILTVEEGKIQKADQPVAVVRQETLDSLLALISTIKI